MKKQIRKIFGGFAISAWSEKPQMKLEEQSLQTTHTQEEVEAYYGNWRSTKGRGTFPRGRYNCGGTVK